MITNIGKYGIPMIKKTIISESETSLIAFSNLNDSDIPPYTSRGVHFFLDDYKFNAVIENPEKYAVKLKQYKYVTTPDVSLYNEMPMWKQLQDVALSRKCGVIWQEIGLEVIATISWSTYNSYSFCFDGVEKGSTVAIGMIGCKLSRMAFMRGYNRMLEQLEPASIICYGEPFPEMSGNLLVVDYNQSKIGKRIR